MMLSVIFLILTISTALRQVSVSLYRCGLTTQVQLAKAWGVTNKTIFNWVAACRKGGMKELVEKARPGAPRKVTDEVKKRIFRHRREGKTLTGYLPDHQSKLRLGLYGFIYEAPRDRPL